MISDSVRNAAEYCDSLFENKPGNFPLRDLKALVFNMESCSYSEFAIPENWSRLYVSGYALAARLWAYFSDSEDNNPIVFTSSVSKNGKKTAVAFRSPVTGRMCFNDFGNRVSLRLSACGYDAVIIRKKNTKYQRINIRNGKAEFLFAENFFAGNTEKIIRELNPDDSTSYILTGSAADRQIDFSSCIADGRISGRGGLGLVFREKNLKVITVQAQVSEQSADGKTIPYVQIAGKKGWAPVKNFTGRTDQRLYHLSMSEIQRVYRKYSITEELPPYEAVLMLGSNTGCFNPLKVRNRYNLCLKYGMDPVSTGSILGNIVNGNTEEQDVLQLITELSQKKYEGKVFRICGLEAGHYDYRGNFSQALSDCNGNSVNLFFNANPDLAVSDFAFWTILGENIEYGLGSCGLSSFQTAFSAFKSNRIKVLVFRYFPKAAKFFFRPEKEASALSTELKTDLQGNDIISLGRRCRQLVYEINKALGNNRVFELPEFFITNPESNYREACVVPLHKLAESFLAECSQDFE